MKYRVINAPAGDKRYQAFVLAFCRTMEHGNILVKGWYDDVEKVIKRDLGPSLVCYSLWYKGKSRNIRTLENCSKYWLGRNTPEGFEKKNIALWKRLGMGKHKYICGWNKIPSTFPRKLKELLNGS